MTHTIEQVCREIIEAGEKATKRPWTTSGEYKKTIDYKIHTPSGRAWTIGDAIYHEQDFDCEYIVTAANNADKLARACLVMRGALEKVGQRQEPDNCNTYDKCLGYLMCCEDVIVDCNKAIAEVEKIIGENNV